MFDDEEMFYDDNESISVSNYKISFVHDFIDYALAVFVSTFKYIVLH